MPNVSFKTTKNQSVLLSTSAKALGVSRSQLIRQVLAIFLLTPMWVKKLLLKNDAGREVQPRRSSK